MKKWLFSLQTQVTAFALAVSLIPLAGISWYVTSTSDDGLHATTQAANDAIEAALTDNLSGQVASKKATITLYFDNIGQQLLTFATTGTVVDAATGFITDATNLAPIDVSADVQRQQLSRYYHEQFGVRYESVNDHANRSIDTYLADLDDKAVRLQYDYIVQNPQELGAKEGLDRATGSAHYHQLHASFHPWARSMLESFGLYDVFLIDPADGRVVYSVFKELDFGTTLTHGPWRDTGLARAYTKALTAAQGDVLIDDFALYPPSYDAPATFLSTPIFENGQLLSIAVFQLPLDKIANTVSESTGLGDTGEVFVVGEDKLLRTDSLHYPDRFSVTESFRHPNTSHIELPSIDQALSGITGEMSYQSYHDDNVIAAFAPLHVMGLNWAIIAEIETSEAMAYARSIAEESAAVEAKGRRNLQIGIASVIPIICIFAILYGILLTRPLKKITTALRSVSTGDLTPRLTSGHRNEFGDMASAFNQSIDGVRSALGSDHVDWSDDFGAMRDSLSRIQSMVEGAPTSIILRSLLELAHGLCSEKTSIIRSPEITPLKEITGQ